ncbi:glutathione S-transferase [Sphingobium sp. C100]|uniref:glutathione S-transferase family protein n=1 Tax=Sphingobium sp. C100 TaxID=1207055 RepID=UPI0003D5B742|nr:glutathione S-transferase [Sphingobium sp. C100]ETI64236.1 glutathione S-transferase [Sphingobium sp. C100]
MLTVHHLEKSQSERIVWLCEELALPYMLVRHERDPATRAAPSDYKALHPAGTAPVVIDGDIVLAESGAIVDYLCRRHGGDWLLPGPGDPGFAAFLFWYHYANGSMMPAIVMDLVWKRFNATGLAGKADAAFAMVEQRLSETEWFAGNVFSAADIMMGFPLTTMRMFAPRDLAPYPHLRAYLARLGARSAYRAMWAKAEPELTPCLD